MQASLGVLKDRLYNAQFPSHVTSASAPPPFPFQRIDVQAEPLPQAQAHAQAQTQVSKQKEKENEWIKEGLMSTHMLIEQTIQQSLSRLLRFNNWEGKGEGEIISVFQGIDGHMANNC